MTSVARACLLRDLDLHRAHVCRTVEGLRDDDLDRIVAPSGWTPRSMLNHLRFDAEVFWLQAVLGGDRGAIGRVRDGWTAPPTPGLDTLSAYRAETTASDAVLRGADLDAPPAWWPPPAVFGGPRLATGWEVVLRVVGETATHAGHLDMAREGIDGHQDLVVGGAPPQTSPPDSRGAA